MYVDEKDNKQRIGHAAELSLKRSFSPSWTFPSRFHFLGSRFSGSQGMIRGIEEHVHICMYIHPPPMTVASIYICLCMPHIDTYIVQMSF